MGRFPGRREVALNPQQKVLCSEIFLGGDYPFIEFRVWQGPFQVLCSTEYCEHYLYIDDRRMTEMTRINSNHYERK